MMVSDRRSRYRPEKTFTCPFASMLDRWLLPWLTRLLTPEKCLTFFGVPTTTISFGFDDFFGHALTILYVETDCSALAGPVAANASVAATVKPKRNLRVMVGLRLLSAMQCSPTETRQHPGGLSWTGATKACPEATI